MAKKQLLILTCLYAFIAPMMTLATGIHITNQTNRVLRIKMDTPYRVYTTTLAPAQTYFFSHHPYNLTVYSPEGTCSVFYDISMNATMFTNLLIRLKNNNPACVVIGYTGRTRQVSSRLIPPVVIDPNYCKRACWNPLRGTITAENNMGILTGHYPTLAHIRGAGTNTSVPDQAST